MLYNDLFYRYELKEINGEHQIILFLSPVVEEFSTELGIKPDEKKVNIKQSATAFVKEKFPNVKKATIIVMAGAVLLGVIPLNKAETHVTDFNMTYLYFGNSQSYLSQIDRTQGNLNLVSPSYFDINADGSLKITTRRKLSR